MSTVLRVVVVDDEPLAREGLALRLGWIAEVQVVAICATVSEALAAFRDEQPDVVFIDIEMPELDGFGVLERVERGLLPAIVFVTAHAEHALRAFRVGAFDYLLKPFDDATLRATVERARTFADLVRGGGEDDVERSAEAARSSPVERITVRHDNRVLFVDPSSLDWIEAAGDNVRLHAGRECYTLRSTMRAIEERLDAGEFVRVHRGAIVARRLIRELQPYSRGEHLVVLTDGTKLPLSRRFRRAVEAAVAKKV